MSRSLLSLTAPGLIQTAIFDPNHHGSDDTLVGKLLPTTRGADLGALTTLHALLSKSMRGKTGFFLQPYYSPIHMQSPILPFSMLIVWEMFLQIPNWGLHRWAPHPDAYREDFAKLLWEESLVAVGLS